MNDRIFITVAAIFIVATLIGCGNNLHPAEPEMVSVNGRTFWMGGTAEQGEDSNDNEFPLHQVTISSFHISKYPVTQRQWRALMGTTIRQFRDKADNSLPMVGEGDNYPVYYVSWDDAQEFIRRLNEATGKQYRLPTEAEWEYAARGGAKSSSFKYSGSNNINDVAWFSGNSGGSIQSAGALHPNELGIYDMSGNVSEWCSDWYGDYSSTAQTNPPGPSSGAYRVYRGGSWNNAASDCRVTIRKGGNPGSRLNNFGFRVVLGSSISKNVAFSSPASSNVNKIIGMVAAMVCLLSLTIFVVMKITEAGHAHISLHPPPDTLLTPNILLIISGVAWLIAVILFFVFKTPAYKITPENETIDVGKNVKLTVISEPEAASKKMDWNWTSGNENIATVNSDGVVSGIKEGNATITAMSQNDKISTSVTVKRIPVDSVSLNIRRLTLILNEKQNETLVETVHPADATEKSVTWSSDDDNVVRVINGTIFARNAGKAVVTVRSNENRNISATCTITVEKQVDNISTSLTRTTTTITEPTIIITSIPSTLREALANLIDSSNFAVDQRLAMMQPILNKFFASPNALVRIVGRNGTLIRRETAEDFLRRIASSHNLIQLVEQESQKAANGKYTEINFHEIYRN